MATTRMPRVVVGVDDSLSGLEALRFAAAEARRRGVVLRAIRAWQFAIPWYDQDAGQLRAEMVDGAAMVLHNSFQQAMGGLPTDVVVEAVAVEGPPAAVLVRQAGEEGDLLVVGRPGRGWRQRLRRARRRLAGLQRVDLHCVLSATCPVVTVGAPVDCTGGLGRDVVAAAEALLRDAAPGQSSGRPPQLA
jgi:nucleotide-binding universal stress UspA family protein